MKKLLKYLILVLILFLILGLLKFIKNEDNFPVFDGLDSLTIELGEKVDLFDKVRAYDYKDGKLNFKVDDSQVNYNEIGSYVIYYSAVDSDGNKRKEKRQINIIPKSLSYMIEDFPTFNQFPEYPNGCESAALYNLLRFYNINVTMKEIVNLLKKGTDPYRVNGVLYGGNPEIEFVGDPRDKYGYGVYQKPIIDVANHFKEGMIDYTGHSLDEVLDIVKENIPVQVWVSINLSDTQVCATWIYKETGELIDWICDLHSVVIVGFNSKVVYVSDSYTGSIQEYDREQFENIYNLFGKRAIYYSE